MRRFVGVRHLPTAWNDWGLLQGVRDVPIRLPTRMERRALRRLREQLDALTPFHGIHVSELGRTAQTARLLGYPCEVLLRDPRLNELDFGPFEGRSKEDLLLATNGDWFRDPSDLVLGESLEAFSARIAGFVEALPANTTTLVVGHGAWLRAMKSLVETGDLRTMNKGQLGNGQAVVVLVAENVTLATPRHERAAS